MQLLQCTQLLQCCELLALCFRKKTVIYLTVAQTNYMCHWQSFNHWPHIKFETLHCFCLFNFVIILQHWKFVSEDTIALFVNMTRWGENLIKKISII